ncbi:hypothetical protein AEST_19430 [Alishewanella aestuarii B11]|uniref:DUF2971 domain-containing protein n=1 Tax=Alishewanella aestuarii B11 TaxID=1197174 RepID=J1QH70_9ALTE|nr:hypothetical protein [Alishewanella aestuarii]EJI84841.1 hypothetical protein AEST_19430 [Alishewanella aestuarii B11]
MTSVLRYLTREKFEWLLGDQGMYVGPASQQSDESEGIYDASFVVRDFAKKAEEITEAPIDAKLLEGVNEVLTGFGASRRDSHFISSWYVGEKEDINMWSQYGTDGVAILSSSVHLNHYLPEPLKHATEFVFVTYDDAKKAYDVHNPLHYKNNKYSHENEFRIIFNLTKYQILTGYDIDADRKIYVGDTPSYLSSQMTSSMSELGRQQSHLVLHKKNPGYILHYQLKAIVREIRINPNATDEELEYIRSVCNQAGLECPVNHSELKKQNSVA